MDFVRQDFEELARYIKDRVVAQALLDWAADTDRVVQVPARRWHRTGHSGAWLTRLYIVDERRRPQLVVLKVLPAGQAAEAATHRRAIREAPEPFRDHLAVPAFDAIRLEDGRLVTFQALAGHGDDMMTVSDLPLTDLPDILRTVTKALIGLWNPDFTVLPADVATVLRRDLAEHPSALGGLAPTIAAGPRWIAVDGVVVPNPGHLTGTDSLLAGERLDFANGRVHGDLHDGNLLVWQRAGLTQPGSFTLVDLTTYASDGQLGHDPVRMLLCGVARLLDYLSEPLRPMLSTILTVPDAEPTRLLPPLATDLRDAVYDGAAPLLRGCGTWPNQYLVSLVSQGMAMATFENLGARRRWWFFELAARSARELLIRLGQRDAIPSDARPMDNAFEHAATVLDLTERLPIIGQQRRRKVTSRNA